MLVVIAELSSGEWCPEKDPGEGPGPAWHLPGCPGAAAKSPRCHFKTIWRSHPQLGTTAQWAHGCFEHMNCHSLWLLASSVTLTKAMLHQCLVLVVPTTIRIHGFLSVTTSFCLLLYWLFKDWLKSRNCFSYRFTTIFLPYPPMSQCFLLSSSTGWQFQSIQRMSNLKGC